MIKNQQFQIIAKPVGPICNLDCTYCFYLPKSDMFYKNHLNEKSGWIMSDEVLEIFIKQKIQSCNYSEESFVWQGGEPTLAGIDFFHNVINYQKKYANGKKINNSIQTNGMLIDDEWSKFFSDNNFLVGISIDGPAYLHNKYRFDKVGKPTFEKVLQAIELLKKYQVKFNTLTSVHKNNAEFPLEIYNFLKSIGSEYLQFIPIVEKDNESVNSEFSVKPEKYGQFLISIFNDWVQNDVGQIFVQNFDVSLQAWYGQAGSLCIFNATCGFAPVFEHNGDFYTCDHFVYQSFKVGNILNDSMQSILTSEQMRIFGKEKRDTLPQLCQECKFLFACNGECPKNRILKIKGEQYNLNYLCEAYKMYFEFIDPYMEFMANELKHRRSPANVMEWITQNRVIER